MANHGVVTYGVDLLNAYMNMETVEHFAKIALVTHMLGKQQTLSEHMSTSCAKSAPNTSPTITSSRKVKTKTSAQPALDRDQLIVSGESIARNFGNLRQPASLIRL